MYITDKNKADTFDNGKGEIIHELIGKVAGGSDNYSVAIVEMLPGSTSDYHHHPIVEECFYFLEGHARMRVNDEDIHISPGQIIALAAGDQHQVFNDSKTEIVKFMAFCTPAWTPDCSVFAN